ncbi:uncharacterized protein LOC120380736 [Mauremys reevesii]|uniref:uncharacterized protein LOC120380736 n=1 Tax=Mauremys reevesii TaxID=260615 RepID=UPI001940173E|nr:uncharacterized protein LOC120380736 [Mauremys reevesii]
MSASERVSREVCEGLASLRDTRHCSVFAPARPHPRLWVSGSSRRCGGFQRLSPEEEAGVRISGYSASVRDTMTWLSAALLALAPCALSQVQLEVSGPGVGQVSEPLTLTCAVSDGSVTADYWDWYRQLPRGALDWLGEIDWHNSRWRVRYAPSVQGRVTLSADSSKNQFSLHLRWLTAADTATYYCARRDTVTQGLLPSAGDKVGEPFSFTDRLLLETEGQRETHPQIHEKISPHPPWISNIPGRQGQNNSAE